MNNKDIKNIPENVISRLPKYYRYLQSIIAHKEKITSSELSKYVGVSSSLLRHDLHYFGRFGNKGTGYDVKLLYNEICNTLKLNKTYNAVIIGAGSLGSAICRYYSTRNYSIEIKKIFDINPKIIGVKINNIEIQDIDFLQEYLDENPIDIGIICIPEKVSYNICSILTQSGVKALWNFSSSDVNSSDNCVIKNENLIDSLLTLTYRINNE